MRNEKLLKNNKKERPISKLRPIKKLKINPGSAGKREQLVEN